MQWYVEKLPARETSKRAETAKENHTDITQAISTDTKMMVTVVIDVGGTHTISITEAKLNAF